MIRFAIYSRTSPRALRPPAFYWNQDFDAVVIPHVGRALGKDACRAISLLTRDSMPVWLPGFDGAFRADLSEHRVYLHIVMGFTSCGGTRCDERHGSPLCSITEEDAS